MSHSSGYHPQSGGQTERLNQVLETALCCLASQEPTSWSRQLILVEYTHKSLPCSTTSLTPFQCTYGFQPLLFQALEEEVAVPSALDRSVSAVQIIVVTQSNVWFRPTYSIFSVTFAPQRLILLLDCITIEEDKVVRYLFSLRAKLTPQGGGFVPLL